MSSSAIISAEDTATIRRLEHFEALLQRLLATRRPAMQVIHRKLAVFEELVVSIEDRRLAARWTSRLAELIERFEEAQRQPTSNRGEGESIAQDQPENPTGSPNQRGGGGGNRNVFAPLASSSPLEASVNGAYRFHQNGNNGNSGELSIHLPSLSPPPSSQGSGSSSSISNNSIHVNQCQLPLPSTRTQVSEVDRTQRSHLITLFAVVKDLLAVWPLPRELLKERLHEMEVRIALLEDHWHPITIAWRREVVRLWTNFARAAALEDDGLGPRRPSSSVLGSSNRGSPHPHLPGSSGSFQRGRINDFSSISCGRSSSANATLLTQRQSQQLPEWMADKENSGESSSHLGDKSRKNDLLSSKSAPPTESERLELQAFLLAKLKAAPAISEECERISLDPKYSNAALSGLLRTLSTVSSSLQSAGLLEDRLLLAPLYEVALAKLPPARQQLFADQCYPAAEQHTLANLWRYLNNWSTIRAQFELLRTIKESGGVQTEETAQEATLLFAGDSEENEKKEVEEVKESE